MKCIRFKNAVFHLIPISSSKNVFFLNLENFTEKFKRNQNILLPTYFHKQFD